MNCPSCAYQSPYAAMRCPQCRAIFDSEAVETLGHLVYLRERLEAWKLAGLIGAKDAAEVLRLADQEINTLGEKLVPVPLAVGAPTASIVVAPAQPVAVPVSVVGEGVADHLPEPHVHAYPPPHARNGAAAHGAGLIEPPDVADLAEDEEPALAAASLADVAQGPAEARPVPAVTAVPAGPAFEWRNVGTYLLSERTLHGLLGLGAFLILASGVVISTLNPTGLGPFSHLAAVVATTLLFFAAGYFVRQRLHLTIAGATLLGIAGAFVPLTIWTLGQRQILDWETGAIWLLASLVSLPLYLAAQRILRDRTFALLAALAGGSALLAVLNWLGVPLEWGLAALVLLAIGYVRLAWRLGDATAGLGWAFTWTSRVATPLLLVALLFAKLGADAWLMVAGRPLGGWYEYAIGAGWWLGVLFYVQAVRLYHRRRDLFAVAWLLPVAYLLTLTKAPWGAAWYNACFAMLALGYLLEGYRRLTFTPTLSQEEKGQGLPSPVHGRGAGGEGYLALARQPFLQVAMVLALVAACWPAQILASRVVTLYLLAGLCVAGTVLLRVRVPAWIGMLLLAVAFGQHLEYAALASEARPLAWAILSAVLLAAGEMAVRRTGEGDRPLLATIFGLRRGGSAEWRSLLGAPLFAAGYAVSLVALLLALDGYWQAPVANGARKLGTTPILGFVLLLATLAASSVARRTGFFLYFVVWLALIPIGATAVNIRDWLGRQPYDPDAAKLLSAVSLAYLVIAWLVDRGRENTGRYARPIYLAAYLLLPVAMLISSLDRYVALQVVGFSIAVYVASAWLAHVERFPSWEQLVVRLSGSATSPVARAVRTFWLYLAVWLLPGWVLILAGLWSPPLATYALVMSGLALIYPAVGLWIKRIRPEYRWPWYLGGYALSAMAPLVALTDTTVGPIVLTLSVGLYVASAIVGRRSGWLYPVAVLVPVVLWWALGSLGLFDRWYGIGLVALGLAYGGLGLLLQPLGLQRAATTAPDDAPAASSDSRWVIRGRIGSYALPFFVVGYALSALGMARAANQERALLTLAFALGAGQFALSTVIFRQPLFGWVTALAAAGACLASLASYDRWYGVGLVALAIVYGIVGIGVHLLCTGQRRLPIRGRVSAYGLPFLVVGYALGVFGLIWASLHDAGHDAERSLTTLAFGLAVGQYAATAFVFRQPLFGWVTAALFSATYVIGLPLTPLDPAQRGLQLVPGGLLALLIGEGLRRVAGGGRVTAWSAPWLLVTCAAAVAAPMLSYGGAQQPWTLAWWGGTLLLALLTALLREPLGLYPTLIFGSVAFLATGYLVQPTLPTTRSFATLAALTWLFLGVAFGLERRWPAGLRASAYLTTVLKRALFSFADSDPLRRATHRQLLASASGSIVPWVVPLRVAGWATLLVACVGSLPSAQDGLAATAALTVLLVALTLAEGAAGYAWLSLGVGALALVQALRVNGITVDRQPPYWAAASVAVVLVGLWLRTVCQPRVAIWVQPLGWTSLVLAGGGVIVATLVQVAQPGRDTIQLLALTIALAGLTTIGHAFWRRDQHLIYGGVGLLEVGLFMELVFFDVGQPQAFALPAGAYLLMIAYLEWRRGASKTVKRLLELAALALLLGVSLLQAVGFIGDGHDRYVYDTFLLLESAVILALGAVLRWRYTFFLGAVALVADVIILLADPLRALNTWYLVALIGLMLIGAVIWIERQRQQIPLWLEAWRVRLEHWD
jgi:hypothetical protein